MYEIEIRQYNLDVFVEGHTVIRGDRLKWQENRECCASSLFAKSPKWKWKIPQCAEYTYLKLQCDIVSPPAVCLIYRHHPA